MLCKYRGNMHFPDARLENALAGRIAIASEVRRLRPRMVILPYWQARHPDHFRAAELGYEGCFLAGLRKLDAYTKPHRPRKIIYAAQYDSVEPSFIIDITSQFERRMAALLAYQSQYGDQQQASDLFPSQAEGVDRLETVAKFYGQKISTRSGEAFVVKEALTFDDPMSVAAVRTF